MHRILAAFTLLLITCSVSLALTLPGPQTRKPGDLTIIVTASDSIKYIKDSVAIAQQTSVVIDKVHKIRPGDLTYFSFLVSGLMPDKKKNINYSVGYRVSDPTGKILFESPNHARGKGKAPETQIFLMADPGLELVMENADPKGKYRIEAKVTDLVTRKTATDVYEIDLVK